MAAVDVFETEPIAKACDSLLALPNALCTPHIGYVEVDNHDGVRPLRIVCFPPMDGAFKGRSPLLELRSNSCCANGATVRHT